MQLQRDDFIHMITMRPYSAGFFRLCPLLYCGHVRMTGDSHCFSEEEGDTPQAPYPCVNPSWPKLSDTYWSSYAECRCDDPLHMQSRRHMSLHSYASNCSNAQRSRSVPSIIVFTLVPYTTYLSLIIFKIIPHPMTLLTAFPLQVIILHLI
jgi:hypothetical protein